MMRLSLLVAPAPWIRRMVLRTGAFGPSLSKRNVGPARTRDGSIDRPQRERERKEPPVKEMLAT